MKPHVSISHSFLVDKAAIWLRARYPVVITEYASCSQEHPDVLGINAYCKSTLIEVKASRSDFLNDGKKAFRRRPEYGMGQFRYYAAPPGVIKLEELPDKWGLLEWYGRGWSVMKRAQKQEHSLRNEMAVLVSCLRRLGLTVSQGVSIKCYQHQTQCRTTLSVSPCDL